MLVRSQEKNNNCHQNKMVMKSLLLWQTLSGFAKLLLKRSSGKPVKKTSFFWTVTKIHFFFFVFWVLRTFNQWFPDSLVPEDWVLVVNVAFARNKNLQRLFFPMLRWCVSRWVNSEIFFWGKKKCLKTFCFWNKKKKRNDKMTKKVSTFCYR